MGPFTAFAVCLRPGADIAVMLAASAAAAAPPATSSATPRSPVRVAVTVSDRLLAIATVIVLDPLADLAITLGSLLRLAGAGRRVVRRPDAGEWIDLPSAVRANAGAVNVKTLLGRDPVPMACLDGAALVEGERVLVTGAGGSIGSEIAVMLARSGCAHLTLVDNCEHNLFSIERRIRDIAPNSPVRAMLLDVRDRRHVFTAIVTPRAGCDTWWCQSAGR
jgi:O-antigen biosynthesis protein WbqV